MTQEIITYSIGIIVAIIIGRWLYLIIKNGQNGECTSCTTCKQNKSCKESE
ncbi:MAG: FeoB-associated Cys-rich membrane protein [Rikenellaceae bacterium]